MYLLPIYDIFNYQLKMQTLIITFNATFQQMMKAKIMQILQNFECNGNFCNAGSELFNGINAYY